MLRMAIFAATGLLLASCSSSSPTTSPTADTSTGPPDSVNGYTCNPVPKKVLKNITIGLTVEGGGEAVSGQYVNAKPVDQNSKGFPQAYVGATVEGPNGFEFVGTYAVNTIEQPSYMMPLDRVAREFSDAGSLMSEDSTAGQFRDFMAQSDAQRAADKCERERTQDSIFG